MRKTTIVLNSIVPVSFMCFLACTFVARQHLDGLARGFVTEKTLQYSAPLIELADQSLEAPLVQRLLSAEPSVALGHEIDEYRQDPPGYLADLTRQSILAPKPENPNPLLAKVASIKERVRTCYDNTLTALIADLRIFATTNLFAGLIALVLAYRSRQHIQKSIVWFSFLMFAAVLYCSYLYIDDLTFFRLLFRTHRGWWYPIFLCVVLVGLYLAYGRIGRATEPSHPPELGVGPDTNGESPPPTR